MSYFQNILVGVDLSRGDWLASADGETPSHFACESAVDLAAANNKVGNPSAVHFLAALDLDERTKWLIEQDPNDENSVVEQAEKALSHQVAAAVKEGVEADTKVVFGRSRLELVHAAQQGGHDVVMIGSRGHGLLSNMFMGSTALELLRKSNCPVWIVKAHTSGLPKRILVGTDFSPVCTALFDRAVELAKLFGSELHVTHVVEEAKRPFLQFTKIGDDVLNRAHGEALERAKQQMNELASRPDVQELSKPLVTHLVVGVASNVVVDQIKDLEVDLLMMGTVAWAGVPGLVIGSTASKLLPNLTCSLLTMRPEEID